MAIEEALVLGPYNYDDMSTMSGALVGIYSSGLSNANIFSITAPTQFWVCIVQAT